MQPGRASGATQPLADPDVFRQGLLILSPIRPMPRRRFALLLLPLLVLAACRPDREEAPTPALPDDAPVPATAFTTAHFQQLRWLEGTWRGSDERQQGFVEDFRMIDDSTIQIVYFADSTMADSLGAASIAFRAGEIVHRVGPGLWHATSVEQHAVHFVPRERARYGFTWSRESEDEWTATTHEADGATVHHMERIGR
jgi:hypothetical protein